MDVTLLRTLAEKSILGFGKHNDLSVQDLLNLNKTTYLRWVYYNCSMISFNDEILETIHIPDEFKINKPGKEPEKHDELNTVLWAKINGFEKMKKDSHRRRVRKGKFCTNDRADRLKFSKGNLQAKNHNH